MQGFIAASMGFWLVGMVGMCWGLDWMTFVVFSDVNDSVSILQCIVWISENLADLP